MPVNIGILDPKATICCKNLDPDGSKGHDVSISRNKAVHTYTSEDGDTMIVLHCGRVLFFDEERQEHLQRQVDANS